ncbi:MAG: hypothetical protein KDC53_11125 [Saprospiraceae bacterium]|nr:hypothetical protein [Saprospiraceae bacterium]
MNKLYTLLIPLSLVILTGCQKDDEGVDVSIRMQLLYHGEPMLSQQAYSYPDGKAFILTKFSTYMSDLVIYNGNTSQELKDVQMLNMTETLRSQEGTADGLLVYAGKTKLSSINQLDFNLGLTPEQNSTIPADYDSGTPLSLASEYWLAWESYIFTKIEGWIDLNGDGVAEEGVALHLGSDEVMKSFSFALPTGMTDIVIQIDLGKIFEQNGKIYDIEANPQIHSLSQIDALRELSNNLEQAVSLKTPL